MLKSLKTIALVGLLTISNAYAITLTPNQNYRSGDLPDGHPEITFKLSDGNWVKDIYFPENPRNNDKVTINSNATYDTYLDGTDTDLPFYELLIEKGDKYVFVYNSSKKQWINRVDSVQSPPNEAPSYTVKIGSNNISRLDVADGQWTSKIVLPELAGKGKFVYVHSRAAYPSKIYASGKTYDLKKGGSYLFSRDGDRWVVETKR